MADLTRGYSFGATEQVTAAKLHSLVDSGSATNIATSDIADNAVTSAKIQSVSGATFTGLASIPSGAGEIPVANLTLASQAEAEAGTNNTKLMTPLRTKESITENVPIADQAEAEAGTDNTKMMTPLRVKQSLDEADGETIENVAGELSVKSSAFSPVIFSWNGKHDAGGQLYMGTDIKVAAAADQYVYFVSDNSSLETFLRYKFKKTTLVDTLNIYVSIWSYYPHTGYAQVKIYASSLNTTINGDIGNTPQDKTGTIDVSSLTDGNVYDGYIQLCHVGSTAAYLSRVLILGS